MSPISAASTAAFIKYDENWDLGNGLQRVSRVAGASFTLPFRGSAFTVYGRLGSPNDPLSVTNMVDITIDDGVPVRFFDIDGPMVHNITLNSSVMHTAQVQVISGTFSFELATWESGDVFTGNQTIQVGTDSSYYTQGEWAPIPLMSEMCTGSSNSSITFNFHGNSIIIQGEAPFAPVGVLFSAIVDEQSPEQRMIAYNSSGVMIDLYRNDNLGEGYHAVTLTTLRGGLFCISRALIYNVTALPPPSRSNGTSSAGPGGASSTSKTPSNSLDPRTPSSGQISGIVIGTLLLFCFITGGLHFLWHRRSRSRPVGYADVMADEMVSMERNGPRDVPRTPVPVLSAIRRNNVS